MISYVMIYESDYNVPSLDCELIQKFRNIYSVSLTDIKF